MMKHVLDGDGLKDMSFTTCFLFRLVSVSVFGLRVLESQPSEAHRAQTLIPRPAGKENKL